MSNSLIGVPSSKTTAIDDTAEQPDSTYEANGDAAPLIFGPLSIDTFAFARCFKLRQVVKLSDKLKASFGASYKLNNRTLSPIGSLIYQFDECTRAEVTERGALLYRKWTLGNEKLAVRLKAEAKVGYKDYPVHNPWFSRPEWHLSVEGVKPFKYHLLCVGLVLLCKVPFSLNDKDEALRLPGLPGMSSYGRLSVKRKGPAQFSITPWEGALILDV